MLFITLDGRYWLIRYRFHVFGSGLLCRASCVRPQYPMKHPGEKKEIHVTQNGEEVFYQRECLSEPSDLLEIFEILQHMKYMKSTGRDD